MDDPHAGTHFHDGRCKRGFAARENVYGVAQSRELLRYVGDVNVLASAIDAAGSSQRGCVFADDGYLFHGQPGDDSR
jgi:hypothetical protein